MNADSILVWDRRHKRLVPEKVQGEAFLRLLYESAFGRWAAGVFFSRKMFSRLYAAFHSGKRSAKKIAPFVRKYAIDIGDFEQRPYASFNDFFARRFKPGARSFLSEPSIMPAFAEARYLAWQAVVPGMAFPVKGRRLSVEELLGFEAKAAEFLYGPLIIARLAPQDYHRVHFVDSGRIVEHYRIVGPLHSVNPIALSSLDGILSTNAREVTIQETESFGRIAYVEVGAMTVGRIVQHLPSGACPRRGDEKSHFEYGASTVLLLGQPGRWIPDSEILEHTGRGIETLVELGTAIAHLGGKT
jgi:phosphatidylserine decarboxylase